MNPFGKAAKDPSDSPKGLHQGSVHWEMLCPHSALSQGGVKLSQSKMVTLG